MKEKELKRYEFYSNKYLNHLNVYSKLYLIYILKLYMNNYIGN